MTFLALIAIIFFGFAVYNLTCAFVDIPTKKTSQMMMLSRKQQGTKNEKLLDVYVTKIAGWIAPYLRLDRLKRNKVQRALDIAGLQLTPEVYTARAWVLPCHSAPLGNRPLRSIPSDRRQQAAVHIQLYAVHPVA